MRRQRRECSWNKRKLPLYETARGKPLLGVFEEQDAVSSSLTVSNYDTGG